MLYIEVIPAYCENKQNMWNTVDKTQVSNYRAFDTCTVFEGDPSTRILRRANGDGLNIALVHGAVYWHACRSSVIV
jgi:hypothetical protein